MSNTSYDTRFNNFLVMFLDNIHGAIKINSPPFQLLSEADSHWQRLFFDGQINHENRIAYNLMNYGHNIFRSCVSLAFSGHIAPVPSVLRTSLECCLYAFMISQNPELGSIWLNRSTDKKSRADCRNAFSAKKAIGILSLRDDPFSKKCDIFHEELIDVGAHPNIEGVFANLKLVPMIDHDQAHISYLHGNGNETANAVLSCCILIQIALQLACYSMPIKSEEHKIAIYLQKYNSDLNNVIELLKHSAN